MKKYVTEFIGTFFLVLTMGLCIVQEVETTALAIGSAMMIMVYMGCHVSGAHYNPAVSLAAAMRGALPAGHILPYILSQIGGSIMACIIVNIATGGTFAPAPGPASSVVGALLIELSFTFALALVVLNAATSKRTEGNSYYGLAIGFTIFVAFLAGGAISGGAFNPALAIGTTLIDATMGNGGFSELWLYIVGPLAGGALAVLVFNLQERD